MEELWLRKIVLRTERCSDLENFLVEVLGAEITHLAADSFLADVAGITFEVRPGTPVLDAFEFWVTPAFMADIISRWEFYQFRRGATLSNVATRTSFSCQDTEGRVWSVFTRPLLGTEHPPVSVRNC